MGTSHDAIVSRLDELSRAVCELERRTAALERRSEREALPAAAMEALPAEAPRRVAAEGLQGAEAASALGPLFGWALMGLAGAYLLRALTEAGTIPGYGGLATGIVYAAWWLYLAERRAREKPVFSTVHALTAALILAPMLWEMTVRFRLVGAATSSAVVVAFAVIGLAIAWKRGTSSIAWIVTLTGLATATAVFRDSHDLRVWVVTILAIAVAVEAAACRDHWLSLRWIAAGAADLAVLMVAWLGSRPVAEGQVVAQAGPGLVLGAQIALLTIYLASTVDRTIFRGLTISGFEIGQMAVAFAISIGGALHTLGTSGGAGWSVGIFCLLGGAACYLVSFAFLDKDRKQDRNFFTYSTFGLLLVTAGCQVMLSGAALAGVWAGLAVAMSSAGFLRSRDTLRVHGAVYLAMAALSSKLLPLAAAQVARRGADPGHVGTAYLLALAGAVACYAAIVMVGRERLHWRDRVEAVLMAALAVWGTAGVLSEGLAAFVSPAASLRTALLTAMAIGAAWAAAKWDRPELDRIAWPLMGVAGLKLLAEDFARGQSHSMVVSLILFGGGLILLPRLGRVRKRLA